MISLSTEKTQIKQDALITGFKSKYICLSYIFSILPSKQQNFSELITFPSLDSGTYGGPQVSQQKFEVNTAQATLSRPRGSPLTSKIVWR